VRRRRRFSSARSEQLRAGCERPSARAAVPSVATPTKRGIVSRLGSQLIVDGRSAAPKAPTNGGVSTAACVPTTSIEFSLRANLIAKHSRVYSSTTLSMRYLFAGAVRDEVVGPHMARPLRPQSYAGSVGQPKPAPLRLLARNLEPLAPPDAGDPRHARIPARLVQ
jgi:hypothetical protein